MLKLSEYEVKEKRILLFLGKDSLRSLETIKFLLEKKNKIILRTEEKDLLSLGEKLSSLLNEEIYIGEEDIKNLINLSKVKIVLWGKKEIELDEFQSLGEILITEDFEKSYEKNLVYSLALIYARGTKFYGFDFEKHLDYLNKCLNPVLILGSDLKNLNFKKILPKVKKIYTEKEFDSDKVISLEQKISLLGKDVVLFLGSTSFDHQIFHELEKHEGLKIYFGKKSLVKKNLFNFIGEGPEAALFYLLHGSLPFLDI